MTAATLFDELVISTESSTAASDCRAAQSSVVYRRNDAMALLSSAREADPNCAYTQALFGLMLSAARKSALKPQINEALLAAQTNKQNATRREQHYVSALECVANGDPHKAASIFEAILEQEPGDLLALTFLQGELFWAGDMPRSAKVSAKLESHWKKGMPHRVAFLAHRAFDLEEINLFDEAESLGREAIDLEASNIWAAHAVAHVLYMKNQAKDGAGFLEQLSSNWQQANQLQFHLWWHHCLFLIEQQKFAEVLGLYDSHVRNTAHPLVEANPDLFLDIQNCASLLWRLSIAGVDVEDRWHTLKDIIMPRVTDMSSAFTSAHIALILAATEDAAAQTELLAAMQDYAQHDSNENAVSVKAAIPAVKAAMHHHRAEHSQVCDVLLPHLHTLHKMGGSHAQQDVFYQLLFDSAKQSGNTTLTSQLHHRIEAIGFHEPANRVMYAQ